MEQVNRETAKLPPSYSTRLLQRSIEVLDSEALDGHEMTKKISQYLTYHKQASRDKFIEAILALSPLMIKLYPLDKREEMLAELAETIVDVSNWWS